MAGQGAGPSKGPRAGPSKGPKAGSGASSSRKRARSDTSSGNDIREDEDLPQINFRAIWAELVFSQVQKLVEASSKLIYYNAKFAGTAVSQEDGKIALTMFDHSERVGQEVLQLADFVDEYASREFKKPQTEGV